MLKNRDPFQPYLLLANDLKKLFLSRFYQFYEKFNIFHKDQYGFLKTKSNTDAILKITYECFSSADNKQIMISFFLDFSKAFDTVVPNILCRKLECYAIR